MLVIWLIAGTVSMKPAVAVATMIATAIVGVALWIARPHYWNSRRVIIFVIAASLLSFLVYAVGENTGGLVMAWWLLLVGVMVPATILRTLFRRQSVDFELLWGAISIYFLVGIAFSMAMIITAHFDPQPILFVNGELKDGSFRETIYFSFVTLSTTGYGDITPASNAARSIAVIEAIGGQLYLGIAMAAIVSALVGRGRAQEAKLPE